MRLIGFLFATILYFTLTECQVIQYNPYVTLPQQVQVPQATAQQYGYNYGSLAAIPYPQMYAYQLGGLQPISQSQLQYGQYGYNPYPYAPAYSGNVAVAQIPNQAQVPLQQSDQIPVNPNYGVSDVRPLEVATVDPVDEPNNVDQLLANALQQGELHGQQIHGEQYFWGRSVPMFRSEPEMYRRVKYGNVHRIKNPLHVIKPSHFELYKYQ